MISKIKKFEKKTLTHRWLMIIIMNNMVILHHTSWVLMIVAALLARASWPKDLLYFIVVLVVIGVPPILFFFLCRAFHRYLSSSSFSLQRSLSMNDEFALFHTFLNFLRPSFLFSFFLSLLFFPPRISPLFASFLTFVILGSSLAGLLSCLRGRPSLL